MKFLEFMEVSNYLTDQYNGFRIVETIDKKELIEALPKQYKTATKLKYLKSLGDEITEEEFVGLLLIQTHDYDYINYEYFIKYYDLKLDKPNNMIIFNDRFTYSMCKMERLYVWWIVNNLQLHPMFSKYMDGQLQFTLQKKLENKMFALKDNFKYDFCFIERDIGIEINENHHSKAVEKKKDLQKVSLAKFHGIAMISLITDKCDNITKFVKDLYKDKKIKQKLCKNILLELGLPESFELYDHISDLVQSALLSKMGRSASKALKKDIKNFNGGENYIIVTKSKVNDLINTHVKSYIYNSEYLTEFLNSLYDYLLCSLLSDYDFRQDYIEKVFLENLILLQENRITKIKNMPILNDKFHEFITERFTTIYKICIELTSNTSNDCVKLFEYKKRSLDDPNNRNVITIVEISDLCAKFDNIEEFMYMIEDYCDLVNVDRNSLISWEDVNTILIDCDVKKELSGLLLLYYKKIDSIYENIIRRMNIHSLRITSTTDDYNNYIKRIKKKCIVLEKRAIAKFANLCINDNIKDNLKYSNSILDREFKQKVTIVDTNSNITINYNNNDLYMLSLTGNETRINNLYNEFYSI